MSFKFVGEMSFKFGSVTSNRMDQNCNNPSYPIHNKALNGGGRVYDKKKKHGEESG